MTARLFVFIISSSCWAVSISSRWPGRTQFRDGRGRRQRTNSAAPVGQRIVQTASCRSAHPRLAEAGQPFFPIVGTILATQTAGSAPGPWRRANSPALALALPNAYFDSLGIPILTGRR
jgi:hypothetical protein